MQKVLNGKASSVENNEAVITIFVEIPSFVLSGKQMGICSLDFSVNVTLSNPKVSLSMVIGKHRSKSNRRVTKKMKHLKRSPQI